MARSNQSGVNRSQQKTFLEQIQVSLSRPCLWEQCRDLTKALISSASLSASSKELRTAFSQVCGEIFGYPAGGSAAGWNVGTIIVKNNDGNSGNRDFYAVFNFLNTTGPMLELIDRLTCHLATTSDAYQLYEFPVSQLPASRQTLHLNVSRNVVYLSPFEYYFYHFASCIVRRHQLTEQQQQPEMASNVGDFLYPVLLEDYLNAFLPLDLAQQVKLFTKSKSHLMTPQISTPTTVPSPMQNIQSSAPKGRATLFRHEFTSRERRINETSYESEANIATSNKSLPYGGYPVVTTNETWRSEILVKVFTLFWLESYTGEMNVADTSKGDCMPVCLSSSASLPSGELLRVLRMFLKHSHYFSNSCKSGGMYIPSNFNSDIFCGDPEGKRSLFTFFIRTIDHWPLDASFRLVLETWLSYIQPWRYCTPRLASAKNDDASTSVDSNQWAAFINENYKFYTTLLAKILSRFFWVDLRSNKNAYMLYRVAKVYSQENLLSIIRDASTIHRHFTGPSEKFIMERDSKVNLGHSSLLYPNQVDQNMSICLFDNDFKDLLANLLLACLDAKKAKLFEFSITDNMNKAKAKAAGAKDVTSRLLACVFKLFSNSPGNTISSDRAETEKALQHLDFVSETFASLFQLREAVAAMSSGTSCRDDADETGGKLTSNSGCADGATLSPSQRMDILQRKVKVETRHDGNPDTVPIRSDESALLVKFLLFLSKHVNQRFGEQIERCYYQNSGFGYEVFRQLCCPPCLCRGGDWDVLNTSNGGSGDGQEALDMSLCGSLRRQKCRKTRLPPRINLRPLASYRVLCYVAFFYFLSTMVFGKSLVVATLYMLVFLSTVILAKAFIRPIRMEDNDLTENSIHLSYDGF